MGLDKLYQLDWVYKFSFLQKPPDTCSFIQLSRRKSLPEDEYSCEIFSR
jgi:hypothetical protein